MRLSDFLPTTRREMEIRGWDEADIILFSGDAYVDHPSFGAAVIGRTLEAAGYRVAIVPQPDWHGDYRDFKKLGRPRLFFGIAPGCMDSMVNKYTAARRLRSEDAYSPDGRHDCRPDYPTIVYSRILKQLFPDVPIVLGGIEASMRRITQYDYWQDKLLPCILLPSGADAIIYGMGEKTILEIARVYDSGGDKEALHQIPQTVYLADKASITPQEGDIVLHSHSECLRDKRSQAENVRHLEEESNRWHAHRMLQETDGRWVVVNPPYPPLTTEELDAVYELPFTRLPHPKYAGKRIPAYDMIKHSICLHRGCFGGCAFCTISAHQGKFIVSRSKESILREVKKVMAMPDFKGYISDLGGPSANMYSMGGRDKSLCERCARPSCIHPSVCRNLSADHSRLTDIYRSVDRLPGIKKSFVGSGVRYDLILNPRATDEEHKAAMEYARELIVHHVSGRLKVAPEHTSDSVLKLMRKPSFSLFKEFKQIFDRICHEEGLRQQLIPYFISSHPGCHAEDMAELAVETKRLDFQLEQVQDFTPTPLTISTETWYTGFHPYTLEPIFSAKTPQEKQAQRQFFFWYKPEERASIMRALRAMNRPDLITALYGRNPVPTVPAYTPRQKSKPAPTRQSAPQKKHGRDDNQSQKQSNKSYDKSSNNHRPHKKRRQ